ncbi:MAG TPA: hypothetical protein VG963_29605 [Polyangiaceae bacterium]|nr:hypothetical protein [Polyangiaceae bacterium]
MMNRRNPEAARRLAERRQREDDAPRLAAAFPQLESLAIRVVEASPGIANPVGTYTRRVVVASAPALFVLPCGDSQCRDGGHDLTHEILSGLRQNQLQFAGESSCRGFVGNSECRRVLRYVASATFRS